MSSLSLTTHRKMYWTTFWAGVMKGAQMDGSDASQIVGGLNGPAGIVIDYGTNRMYWTEYSGNRIRSSNLDGTEVRTIVTLPSGTDPWGIAIHNNQIYWGNYEAKSLQRSSKSGHGVQTVFIGSSKIQQLVWTGRNFSKSRQNHCEGQNCTNICALTATAFRCVPS